MSIVVLESTLSYLRFNCIWPKKGQDLNPDKWYYIRFVMVLLASSIILIGTTLHLIVSIKHGSFRNLSEDYVIIVAEIGVLYFLGIFVSYQKQIASIFADLSDFDKFEKPQNFDKRNRKLVFLSKTYKNFIDIVVAIISLAPCLKIKSCEQENQIADFKEICGLTAPTWMPFDISGFPLKYLFLIWQIYASFMSFKGAAVISFAIMETMEHLILRIQHLKLLLNKAIGTEDDTVRQQLFSSWIKYHINIFDIGKKIDKCYAGCLFLHVLVTGVLFGCIGYRFMEEFTWNGLSLFIGWFLSLYIVCISGQRLIDEGTFIAEVAYNSDWYNRDVYFQKNIIFIIIRSQKPILVHAGPFSHVSHIIILTILKTAYSYLTLLRATTM